MMKTHIINTLVKRSLAGQILDDSLLPMNNNPAYAKSPLFLSLTVLDADGVTPVGYGTIATLSDKQAYCLIDEADPKFDGKVVTVQEIESSNKDQLILKIKSVSDPRDFTKERLFVQAFDDKDGERSLQRTIVETLIRSSIGSITMDSKKNVTIDICATNEKNLSSRFAAIRDDCGFVVTDRHQFQRIQIDRHVLTALEKPLLDEYQFERINKENVMSLIDFYEDMNHPNPSVPSSFSKVLTALCDTSGVSGFLAMNGEQADGAVLTFKDRILACYAVNDDLAGCLLAQAAHSMTSTLVTLFVRNDSQPIMNQLAKKAIASSRIYRMHTRTTIPFKWNTVYCPNLGLTIF